MEVWKAGWVEGWFGKRMVGWEDERVKEWVGGRMIEWVDELIDGLRD